MQLRIILWAALVRIFVRVFVTAFLTALVLVSCKEGRAQDFSERLHPSFDFDRQGFQIFLSEHLLATYRAKILAEPQRFLQQLYHLVEQDRKSPYLSRLVDKQHALPANYKPLDLVDLGDLQKSQLSLARGGLRLRRILLPNLLGMSAAAQEGGILLPLASTYRSFSYQDDVFRRYTERDGIEEANRYSARPGQSQHQLGLVIDFAPISQAFAKTPASIWLLEHALDYGFSLSYPQGEEAKTGYIYEPWHYRYVGPLIAEILTTYFQDYQQVFLQFWYDAKAQLERHLEGT